MSETPEDVYREPVEDLYPEGRSACDSRDCQFVHDHTQPTPAEPLSYGLCIPCNVGRHGDCTDQWGHRCVCHAANHGSTRAAVSGETPEDVYRAAAEAWVIAHRFEPPLDDLGLRHFTRKAMGQPDLRAAVDAAYAAGREAAAQAIETTLAAREAQGCTYIRIADVRQALGGDRRG